MQKSTFNLENTLIADGYEFIIGIDEAGRGPLAGPVVASAVVLRNLENLQSICHCERSEAIPDLSRKSRDCHCRSEAELPRNDMLFNLIRDSKTLSHKQREGLFDFIQENFYVGVGIIDHKTIDRVNILEATFLSMKSALADLRRQVNYKDQRHIVVVDGNKKISNLSLDQKAVPSGDKLVKSISAASIIAKVTRDRIMLEMHEKYPEYGFDRHKGYGTKMHFEMLKKNGSCEIHRRSFFLGDKKRGGF
jgi:ribonuclease HII